MRCAKKLDNFDAFLDDTFGMASGQHPFISFQKAWAVRPDTWFRLGQSKAMIRAISTTPIMPAFRAEIYRVSLIRGAQATTAIEGNTLSENEIRDILAGKSLPSGKQYMEQEVKNVVGALNELRDEIVDGGAGDNLVSPDLIMRFHKMIGKDLGAHFEAVPGQFRRGQVTVGRVYRPPAGSEVAQLMTAFCEWSRREFHYEKGQDFSTAIVQAIVSHVYVAWIHPFSDGNGRTARLLEFYLLLRAGVPDIAAHILSNYYNETRSEYYRQLAQSSRDGGDLTAFIEYAVDGLKDGLQAILETVHVNQLVMAWRDYVREVFHESGMKPNISHRRQMALILSVELEQDYSEGELSEVNEAVRVNYAAVSRRTLQRDISALTSTGLLVHSDNGYRANTAVLRGAMARVRADRHIL